MRVRGRRDLQVPPLRGPTVQNRLVAQPLGQTANSQPAVLLRGPIVAVKTITVETVAMAVVEEATAVAITPVPLPGVWRRGSSSSNITKMAGKTMALRDRRRGSPTRRHLPHAMIFRRLLRAISRLRLRLRRGHIEQHMQGMPSFKTGCKETAPDY